MSQAKTNNTVDSNDGAHPYASQWIAPSQEKDEERELHIYNTFTRTKVPFRPQQGNAVRWYNCGPTVYDASHIGHARNYVTFDIIRRLLEDYFHYDVTLIMNITDIDDKIIIRARQAFLLKKFTDDHPTVDVALLEELQAMWKAFAQSKLGTTEIAALEDMKMAIGGEESEAKRLMHLNTTLSAHRALSTTTVGQPAGAILEAFQDILSPELDDRLGHTVTDPKIFRDLAAIWEAHFLEDMRALNVRPASLMTRVTEFVPQVVACVERILANGYAYEAQGSVYFDVKAFEGSGKGHTYARLCPWSAGNSRFFEEGEGALGVRLGGKRDPRDFALWKASKAGEPAWPSPWGPGRPGWHIECSAMAAAVAPGVLDLHSGGIDLAFPHHDNELAQSEAFYECPRWVNYFVHAGHVHIEGHKMSKSLKNFVTIRDALARYSARQLRIMFLQHQWCAPVYYKESSMVTAVAVEALFSKFFSTLNAHLRQSSGQTDDAAAAPPCPSGEEELKLFEKLTNGRNAIHRALLDNFDTPTALLHLQELVAAGNAYLQSVSHPNAYVLRILGLYLTRMLRIFGLIPDEIQENSIGWLDSSDVMNDMTNSSSTTSSVLQPALEAMAAFRDRVRDLSLNAVKSSSSSELAQQLLQLSDQFRTQLTDLGIVFEDRPGRSTLVKFVDPATIAAQRQEQAAREADRLARRLEQTRLAEERHSQRAARAAIPPNDLFRSQTDRYNQWDERGIPTHDVQGQELSKNSRKKLIKEYETQVELYQKFLDGSLN